MSPFSVWIVAFVMRVLLGRRGQGVETVTLVIATGCRALFAGGPLLVIAGGAVVGQPVPRLVPATADELAASKGVGRAVGDGVPPPDTHPPTTARTATAVASRLPRNPSLTRPPEARPGNRARPRGAARRRPRRPPPFPGAARALPGRGSRQRRARPHPRKPPGRLGDPGRGPNPRATGRTGGRQGQPAREPARPGTARWPVAMGRRRTARGGDQGRRPANPRRHPGNRAAARDRPRRSWTGPPALHRRRRQGECCRAPRGPPPAGAGSPPGRQPGQPLRDWRAAPCAPPRNRRDGSSAPQPRRNAPRCDQAGRSASQRRTPLPARRRCVI